MSTLLDHDNSWLSTVLTSWSLSRPRPAAMREAAIILGHPNLLLPKRTTRQKTRCVVEPEGCDVVMFFPPCHTTSISRVGSASNSPMEALLGQAARLRSARCPKGAPLEDPEMFLALSSPFSHESESIRFRFPSRKGASSR